jgi:serine/threonine protein kinase
MVSGVYTAQVVGAGLEDEAPWLATMYVPGPSLAGLVAEYGPLPEDAVWRLGAGLAEALQAVHGCGLVHRDLKPANVLLAPDGPQHPGRHRPGASAAARRHRRADDGGPDRGLRAAAVLAGFLRLAGHGGGGLPGQAAHARVAGDTAWMLLTRRRPHASMPHNLKYG